MAEKSQVKVRYAGRGWYYVEWKECDLTYSLHQKSNSEDNSIYVDVPAYKNLFERFASFRKEKRNG